MICFARWPCVPFGPIRVLSVVGGESAVDLEVTDGGVGKYRYDENYDNRLSLPILHSQLANCTSFAC